MCPLPCPKRPARPRPTFQGLKCKARSVPRICYSETMLLHFCPPFFPFFFFLKRIVMWHEGLLRVETSLSEQLSLKIQNTPFFSFFLCLAFKKNTSYCTKEDCAMPATAFWLKTRSCPERHSPALGPGGLDIKSLIKDVPCAMNWISLSFFFFNGVEGCLSQISRDPAYLLPGLYQTLFILLVIF